MFQRQWFSISDQIGLTASAMKLESHIHNSEYSEAIGLALSEASSNNKNYWLHQYHRVLHLVQRSRSGTSCSQPISLAFVGFWPNFHPDDNQVLDLVRYAIKNRTFVVTSDIRAADIIFCSCYGSLDCLSLNRHALRILFLGENIRPSYGHFDASISFDLSSYMQRNLYFPLCLLEIDLFGRGANYPDREIHSLSEFTLPKSLDLSSRKRAIVFVGNNCEPFRLSLLSYLRNSGVDVDWFGSQHNPVKDKIALLATYRLNLCFENSFYPGYVTEKPMHSYLASTPCLHWGSDLDGKMLSAHSLFHSVDTSDDYSEILSRCKMLLNSSSFVTIEPLFSEQYVISELSRATQFLRHWFQPYLA